MEPRPGGRRLFLPSQPLQPVRRPQELSRREPAFRRPGLIVGPDVAHGRYVVCIACRIVLRGDRPIAARKALFYRALIESRRFEPLSHFDADFGGLTQLPVEFQELRRIFQSSKP